MDRGQWLLEEWIQMQVQKQVNDVLDKIRAEIKDWQTDIHDNENAAEIHDFVFERIYEILDEYRVESKGKE